MNGGIAVVEEDIFSNIADEEEQWEREVLQRLIDVHQLAAWKHFGKWECVDTLADADRLNAMHLRGHAFWLREDGE